MCFHFPRDLRSINTRLLLMNCDARQGKMPEQQGQGHPIENIANDVPGAIGMSTRGRSLVYL